MGAPLADCGTDMQITLASAARRSQHAIVHQGPPNQRGGSPTRRTPTHSGRHHEGGPTPGAAAGNRRAPPARSPAPRCRRVGAQDAPPKRHRHDERRTRPAARSASAKPPSGPISNCPRSPPLPRPAQRPQRLAAAGLVRRTASRRPAGQSAMRLQVTGGSIVGHAQAVASARPPRSHWRAGARR